VISGRIGMGTPGSGEGIVQSRRLLSRRILWLALLAGCAGPASVVPAGAPVDAVAVASSASPTNAPSGAAAHADSRELPERGSGHTPKPGWALRRMAVAAANPLAAAAGWRTLQAGGNAVDAAVSVQMVLALVEPQSSGLGGGALLLLWDGHRTSAWDGRETAPAAADERLFLRPDGRPMPFGAAVVGGRAVGVPGAVRMLEAVQRAHGRLPWARLFEPAIALAEGGFPVSERLHRQLAADAHLAQDAQARRYFFDAAGAPWPIGHRLRNPALAEVLPPAQLERADALYQGAIAADIVARVRGHAGNPGRLSEADLAAYRPRRRDPLCTDWRQRYRVCGFPPPASGQIAIMQILGMLERYAPAPAPLADGRPTPAWLHVYTEAARLAFADRDRYVADPDYVAPPGGDWRALLAPAYLAQRAALIGPTRMPLAPAGQPAGEAGAWAAMPAQPESGTSHVSIVDAEGRAVALTTTIEAEFGARLMSDGGSGKVGGFLLNNQLTDFSFVPADAAGRPVANRVQPGKRPRSSMSPTLVFDLRDGRLVMTLGSPGGAAIIHYTAKTLLGTLVWGLDVQRAIDLPNYATFGGALLLEAGRFPDGTAAALRALGHEVRELELTSGVQAIERRPGGWFGGADPRREGVVVGE